MPKRLPPNNRPWPANLAFDFGLPSMTPADAEAFVSGLPTSDRNKEFLLLRYRDGKLYDEIASVYDITSAGVRGAVKTMWGKFGASAPTSHPVPGNASSPVPGNASSPVPGDMVQCAVVPGEAVPDDAVPGDSSPPVRDETAPLTVENVQSPRPLSINLANVRRFLGLTPEEFSRPFIDDGGTLITRLETGFSKPSAEILQLICDAWGINRSFLLTGRGEMFGPYTDYFTGLVRLLRKYLSVATFDRKGRQYWKGSLVDDLGRLINVAKLNGQEMCRVVRVLYDFLDVEQFEVMLERMGR